MTTVGFLGLSLAMLLVGVAGGFWAGQMLTTSRHLADIARAETAEAERSAMLRAELAAAEASIGGLTEALEDLRAHHRELLESQRHEANQRQQAETGHVRLMETIAPVAQQLQEMQSRVAQMEHQRSMQYGELSEQLKQTHHSVEASTKAADALAGALKNNSVRGVWGETQLRTLVESAGLLNRVDFSSQHSMVAESGARRPDMVINIAGGKQMAIDAKAPLTAFLEAHREGIEPADRLRLLQNHARAVRAHVNALSTKGYWTGLSASPEFTIAFIPNDQVLAVALDTDPSLMEHAFASGVILATPTNLWGLLKTVAYTWKQDVLTEDAKALFDLGQQLYDRISAMAGKVEKLRRSLETTVRDYNGFVGTLESRVLVTARRMHHLDESAVIAAPTEIETVPKPLTAGEFTEVRTIERTSTQEIRIPANPT